MPLTWGYKIIKNVYIKNGKKSDLIFFFKHATDGQSDMAFLFTSKFCPTGGCLSLPWGYIHV